MKFFDLEMNGLAAMKFSPLKSSVKAILYEDCANGCKLDKVSYLGGTDWTSCRQSAFVTVAECGTVTRPQLK